MERDSRPITDEQLSNFNKKVGRLRSQSSCCYVDLRHAADDMERLLDEIYRLKHGGSSFSTSESRLASIEYRLDMLERKPE